MIGAWRQAGFIGEVAEVDGRLSYGRMSGLKGDFERLVEGIPLGNIRVPRAEFVAIWRVGEHLLAAKQGGWPVAGVAMTCCWMACAAVSSVLDGWRLPSAPVTQRSGLAREELIASEFLAAVTAALNNPHGMEGHPDGSGALLQPCSGRGLVRRPRRWGLDRERRVTTRPLHRIS